MDDDPSAMQCRPSAISHIYLICPGRAWTRVPRFSDARRGRLPAAARHVLSGE